MRIETSEHGLRMTGKAWEVKQKLKEIGSEEKLVDWLHKRQIPQVRLAVLDGGKKK
ncbi:Z-ring formation inhibitor MciZ [Risungbinella massiliensis]|uniref:Z-ring formation inhibitor MciZ n=1 Tax=Risungbinella massiliensis TaxID=1329796 RepID=UPI0009E56D70|nr:Z-ring formation inhibitor MciZ [Risungbinella massiliensis]